MNAQLLAADHRSEARESRSPHLQLGVVCSVGTLVHVPSALEELRERHSLQTHAGDQEKRTMEKHCVDGSTAPVEVV